MASSDKTAYPAFLITDAGADVPAEKGGRGFSGKGWDTNLEYGLIGDPRAVTGGTFSTAVSAEPESRIIDELRYETLLVTDPNTLRDIPALATHWQISADGAVFRFRLNPAATFSDGTAVTSSDVVASWEYATRSSTAATRDAVALRNVRRPVAETKYIVRFDALRPRWKTFASVAHALRIMPARALAEGNTSPAGSGPYALDTAGTVKNESVALYRRTNYWAERERRNIGLHNFEKIRWVVSDSDARQQDLLRRGDVDFLVVEDRRDWTDNFKFDRVQRGLVLKREIHTAAPVRVESLAFDVRRPLVSDARVRHAVSTFLNRARIVDEVLSGDAVPIRSYFPAAGVPAIDGAGEFNRQQGFDILLKMGWAFDLTTKRLMRGDVPFIITCACGGEADQGWVKLFHDDLSTLGIQMPISRANASASDLVAVSYRPERLPDLQDTRLALHDPRLDAIAAAYDREYDIARRLELLHQADELLAATYPEILGWGRPFVRVAYLNRFGHPASYLSRNDEISDVLSLWWVDPASDQRYRQALADPAVQMDSGPTVINYWNPAPQ